MAHASTLTTLADSGCGSLRQAIAAATAGDTIELTCLSGVITLTSGELSIAKNLTINGPEPETLSIDGNASSRIFSFVSGVTVSISGFTITNGSSEIAGGVINSGGTVTITNITVSGNVATR